MSHNITVEGGKTVKLLTAGKYCDQDIIVTAEGSNTDEAYETGYAAGAKSEYDLMWDSLQINGTRTDYTHGFNSQFVPISLAAFKPKYDMHPTNSEQMFKGTFKNESGPVDLVELLERLGRVVDFSKSANVNYLFYQANVKRLGLIDCSSATRLNYTFYGAGQLETIEKLVLTKNIIQYASCFFNSKLKNLTVEGTIAADFDLKGSPLLTKLSIESVMNAIDETTSFTVTFSRTAVNNAFETSEGAADGSTSAEWNTLVATKPNCTISLI